MSAAADGGLSAISFFQHVFYLLQVIIKLFDEGISVIGIVSGM